MLAVSGQQQGVGRVLLGARLIARAEEFYDIPQGSIANLDKRNGNISKARWAISFVLTTEVGWSLKRVAKLFGGQDHKSISYGRDAAKKLLRSDPIFFEAVKLLKSEISPHEYPPI